MKNTMNIMLLAMMLPMTALIISCGSDDPVIPNEEELITDVTFTLSPVGGGNDVVLSWIDSDGDGNGDITGGTLATNTTYNGSILLEQKTTNPSTTTNITLEVSEEAEEHQFFYEFESSLNATFTYDDKDANDRPIGIQTTITTGDVSVGSLTVILRHEPDKSGSGVAEGDKINAGGATDLNITFPVSIQ